MMAIAPHTLRTSCETAPTRIREPARSCSRFDSSRSRNSSDASTTMAASLGPAAVLYVEKNTFARKTSPLLRTPRHCISVRKVWRGSDGDTRPKAGMYLRMDLPGSSPCFSPNRRYAAGFARRTRKSAAIVRIAAGLLSIRNSDLGCICGWTYPAALPASVLTGGTQPDSPAEPESPRPSSGLPRDCFQSGIPIWDVFADGLTRQLSLLQS